MYHVDTWTLTLRVQVPKEYMPKTIITIPSTETMYSPHFVLWTLRVWVSRVVLLFSCGRFHMAHASDCIQHEKQPPHAGFAVLAVLRAHSYGSLKGIHIYIYI